MQFPEVFLGQVSSGALTIPSYGTHIFLLGGLWDTTEPERNKIFVLRAERNTSLQRTTEEETVESLPNLVRFFGELRP